MYFVPTDVATAGELGRRGRDGHFVVMLVVTSQGDDVHAFVKAEDERDTECFLGGVSAHEQDALRRNRLIPVLRELLLVLDADVLFRARHLEG